jgi:hypothetical protein
MSNPNNPLEVQREYHLKFIGHNLQLDMNVFYDDILKSVDILEGMIKKDYKDSFIETVTKQLLPLNKTNILRNKRYKEFVGEEDFDFFKEVKE